MIYKYSVTGNTPRTERLLYGITDFFIAIVSWNGRGVILRAEKDSEIFVLRWCAHDMQKRAKTSVMHASI